MVWSPDDRHGARRQKPDKGGPARTRRAAARRLLSFNFILPGGTLQYPEFDPVALRIGPVAIHWYGLMYLVGFALVYLLGRRRIQSGHTATLTTRDLEDVIFYSVLGVVLGGRLGYVLFYKPCTCRTRWCCICGKAACPSTAA